MPAGDECLQACVSASAVTSATSAIAVSNSSAVAPTYNVAMQRTPNIAVNRASIIDCYHCGVEAAGWRGTDAICGQAWETRSDNPASAMKVSANGAMFGRSMMIARRPGPSGSRRSLHCRSRRPLLLLELSRRRRRVRAGDHHSPPEVHLTTAWACRTSMVF